MIGDVQPFEGARDLLEEVERRGFRLVLASSGQARHVEVFLDLVGGRSLADAWTTAEDAEQTKPEPDLAHTALAKVGGASGVMIGDSVWDVVAAGKLEATSHRGAHRGLLRRRAGGGRLRPRLGVPDRPAGGSRRHGAERPERLTARPPGPAQVPQKVR